MKRTNIGIILKRKSAKVYSKKLKGICNRPTHFVPLKPWALLKAKFSYVPKMLTQIGRPPKTPEIKLATARTLVSVVTYPRSPSFLYLFPLLSNSSRYKNC